MEALNKSLGILTVKRYACSICWGELETVSDPRDYAMCFVLCRKCQDETRGYVSKFFVNRRRGESEFEKLDVTKLLYQTGILKREPREHKTQQQRITELGF